MSKRVGIIGARGHTGAELARLIAARPDMELVYAASRAKAGAPIAELAPGVELDLTVSAPDADAVVGLGLDACVLATPNGAAEPYVAAFDAGSPETVLVDLSADYRFNNDWAYGLPETGGRARLAGAKRIANPGCYATAAQLAIWPLLDRLDGPVAAFGVSGYSGAGTTPNPRNDPERVADNIMPYKLVGHIHENEVRRHLSDIDVRFSPHVAGFFRGLVVTAQLSLTEVMSEAALQARYEAAYEGEGMIAVHTEEPELKTVVGQPGAVVGGFAAAMGEKRAVVCCALDNLLKGAATQALQNLALGLGLDEETGAPA